MQEMQIDSIRVSYMNYQRVVILKELDNDRYLPIWIGPAEADAIAIRLQDVSVPRPLTHDLLGTIIDTLGGSVDHVVVSDLESDTFYAKIVVKLNDKTVSIDSRPSDAIALAVRAQVPIFVEEGVLERAAIALGKETGKALSPENGGHGKSVQLQEGELERLSAFKDFVENLNLEDLGTSDSAKQ